jgi:hypothetical protein
MVLFATQVNDTTLQFGVLPHILSILYRFCGCTTAGLPAIFLPDKCNLLHLTGWRLQRQKILGLSLLEIHESVSQTEDMASHSTLVGKYLMVVIVIAVRQLQLFSLACKFCKKVLLSRQDVMRHAFSDLRKFEIRSYLRGVLTSSALCNHINQ